jgi:hypothetical protein
MGLGSVSLLLCLRSGANSIGQRKRRMHSFAEPTANGDLHSSGASTASGG